MNAHWRFLLVSDKNISRSTFIKALLNKNILNLLAIGLNHYTFQEGRKVILALNINPLNYQKWTSNLWWKEKMNIGEILIILLPIFTYSMFPPFLFRKELIVFVTNSIYLIPIALQPNAVNLRYFKLLIMLDQINQVWNMRGLHIPVAKI